MNQNGNNVKPKVLYRGIKFSFDKLAEIKLSGVDMVTTSAPVIDKDGNKLIGDGNEYGLYMSDNKEMVLGAYGDLHRDEMTIQPDITVGSSQEKIGIPKIAITYEIDTQGIDIRMPKISRDMGGHYNNGFAGDEWIADIIPASNYKVIRIRIGKDILHKDEDVPIVDGNIEHAQHLAVQIIQMRKYRLESLVNGLSKISSRQRQYANLDVIKAIYGLDGVRYTNPNNIDTSNNLGRIKYLMAILYSKENGRIDSSNLKYMVGVKERLLKAEAPELIESLEQIVISDLKENDEKRLAFIQKKTKEGVSYTTRAFDLRDEMMNNILSYLGTFNEQNEITQEGQKYQPGLESVEEKRFYM